MAEARLKRFQKIWRELFLAAFGMPLDELDPWVVDRMTTLLEEVTVHAGDVLFKAGDPADFIYFMEQGRVSLVAEGVSPRTLEGRWVIGGFDAYRQRPPSRTAVALQDFDALRARADRWLDLLEDSAAVARKALTMTATAVANLELLVGLESLPVESRPPPEVPPRPLDAVERLALLTQFADFRRAGVQVLAELAAAADEIWLDPGQSLDVASRPSIFLVVHGEVTANRTNAATAIRSGPFDIVLGAATFIPPAANDWEARASSPSRILSIPLEAWYDVMEEHFDLARATLSFLAERRERLLGILSERAGPEGLVFR